MVMSEKQMKAWKEELENYLNELIDKEDTQGLDFDQEIDQETIPIMIETITTILNYSVVDN